MAAGLTIMRIVNRSSRACGVCRKTLREHALELGKATVAEAAVCAVGCSSAGGISVSREGGGACTPGSLPHDVLMSDSPGDPDVIRALTYASNNALLVGLTVQNGKQRIRIKSASKESNL